MRVFLAILGTVLVSAAQEPADFRVSVDLVPITCAVTDRNGLPVLDMRADEFVVLDNGEPRKVQSLWREVDLPLTIGLIADISGSQASFVKQHRETIKRFLEGVLRPADQAFLVAVGSRVKLVTDLTHSLQELDSGVAQLDPSRLFNQRNPGRTDLGEQCLADARVTRPTRPSCGTLLWNGIYSAARLKMKPIAGRKAFLVLTDGLDNGSNRSLTDAIEAAQGADTVVYSIQHLAAPLIPSSGPRPRLTTFDEEALQLLMKSEALLRRLSGETGARAYGEPQGDLNGVFADIEQDLRSLYVLAFTVPESAQDGRFHSLEVRSKRSGVKVRARKGYLARSQPILR